jgi:hypothetical protein
MLLCEFLAHHRDTENTEKNAKALEQEQTEITEINW